MKILFILPSVGSNAGKGYVKSWQMEPLQIAVLKALTPKAIKTFFFDDRIEEIDYSFDADLIAITVETYTAKRAYEISKQFMMRGKKVVMGGYHATLCPEEVKENCNAIVIGESESLWKHVIYDFQNKRLKREYAGGKKHSINTIPDRSIYAGKKYLPLGLVETSRGCKHRCEFCSISGYHSGNYSARSIPSVLHEIKQLSHKHYFFVDDNITGDRAHAMELFKQLAPLKIKWVGQANLNIGFDTDLLKMMKKSGCSAVLIGFESLNNGNLKKMNKRINEIDMERAIREIHAAGICIYATFMFGYDNDTKIDFDRAYEFAQKNNFFLAAFNHVVPFPKTGLYERLKRDKRLIFDKWWLEDSYRFGDVSFRPSKLSRTKLSSYCNRLRRKFYSLNSIAKRLFGTKANFSSIGIPILFIYANLMMRSDRDRMMGRRMGKGEC